MTLTQRYKKYAYGSRILDDPESPGAQALSVAPEILGTAATMVGNGNDEGFVTQGGSIAKGGLTGMAAGAKLGQSFGPLGSLVGGAVGGGIGTLTGLINGRKNQREFVKEKGAMGSLRLREQNNLSAAKIGADPSLVLGNRYSQIYGNGGALTVPKSSTQKVTDSMIPIAQSLATYGTNDKENMKVLASTYGPEVATEVGALNLRLKNRGSADLNTALGNISRDTLAKPGGNETMRKFYATIQENPRFIDNYYYGNDKPQPTMAKLADGGTMEGSLAKRYMTGGTAKPLASHATEIVGNDHGEGGVKIPSLGAEVENKETTAGNFVFSERLGFAQLHKPIAKAMGKIEKKPVTQDRYNAMKLLKKQESNLALKQEYMKSQFGIQ